MHQPEWRQTPTCDQFLCKKMNKSDPLFAYLWYNTYMPIVSFVFLIRNIQLTAAKANCNRKGVIQPVHNNNVYRHELANARDKPQLQLNVEKLK